MPDSDSVSECSRSLDAADPRSPPQTSRNPGTLLLLGIFLLLGFAALYFASAVVIPVVLAVMLYLLLSPSMRLLAKFSIPKVIAALLMIGLIAGFFSAIGFAVSRPLTEWVQ